jgi:hypothetical protein
VLRFGEALKRYWKRRQHERADALRHAGVEQVRADCRYRVNAEQQDQERCHQRSAADPGHSDKRADAEAGERIERKHLTDDIYPGAFEPRQNLGVRSFAKQQAGQSHRIGALRTAHKKRRVAAVSAMQLEQRIRGLSACEAIAVKFIREPIAVEAEP